MSSWTQKRSPFSTMALKAKIPPAPRLSWASLWLRENHRWHVILNRQLGNVGFQIPSILNCSRYIAKIAAYQNGSLDSRDSRIGRLGFSYLRIIPSGSIRHVMKPLQTRTGVRSGTENLILIMQAVASSLQAFTQHTTIHYFGQGIY